MKLFKLSFLLLLFFSNSTFTKDEVTVEEIRELEELKAGNPVIKEEEKFLEIQTSVIRDEDEDECESCIYGYDLFKKTPTTFALSSNMPVPNDYILGPGDKLRIEYFGSTQEVFDGFVTRNGAIMLPILGPVSIAGLQLQNAESLIRKKVSEELIGTEVYVSISELRSMNIYVVGAAYKPGTFTVSSLASLTNIIFATGGPNEEGSLRKIKVKRNSIN